MVAAAGGDSRLQQILRTRLLRSEGAENNHCFTKEASRGSADAGFKPLAASPQEEGAPDDAAVGKLFCMHSGDTPPPSPRSSSAHPSPEAAKSGSDNEAESTDGLPDSQEVGDGDLSHYDWQFELMNSMPREKALELARVLKRSEKEKVLESAKLRQEVVELKRQMSRSSSTSAASAASTKTRCMPLLSILVALVAVAFAANVMPPLENFWTMIDHKVTDASSAQTVARPASVPSASTTEEAEHVPEKAQAVPAAATEPSIPSEPVLEVTSKVMSPEETPAATVTTTTTTSAETAATAPPQIPPAPRQVRLWAAEVSKSFSKVELWHQALSQDPTAIGMVEADLGKAMTFFPKVTQTFRFAQIFVTRSLLNNKQVAMQANLNLVNTGAAAWPPTTRLRLIHGAGMGLWGLELGQAVMPGAQVELSLQLEVPKRGEGDGSNFARHVWVLADSNNEPFGPLLVAEVVWLP